MEETELLGWVGLEKLVITGEAVKGTCLSWQRKAYAIPRVGRRMCIG